MEVPGHKLKRVRERLNLRYREVEDASLQIAKTHKSDEYLVALSRLSDIENKGTVPSIYRLYSLCTIYRLDLIEVLQWYGVNVANLPADAATIALERTHPLHFQCRDGGEVVLPLSIDSGLDLTRTTHLSRAIRQWGKLPLMLLHGNDMKAHRYAYIGTEDWSMYPILQPGSLLLMDESKRKIQTSGWTSEFDRPIYFLEHRDGYACGWCSLSGNRLILQPHPASQCSVQVFSYPGEVEIVGQVTGVAMRLGSGKRRGKEA